MATNLTQLLQIRYANNRRSMIKSIFLFADDMKMFKVIYKNIVQALKHPSADAVTQNGHKSDTTAANTVCQ